MSIRAEYDREADAIYIRLRAGAVARNVEYGHACVADVDDAGHVIGIEVLGPYKNLRVPVLAERFGFLDRVHEVDAAIEEALPAPPTWAATRPILALDIQVVDIGGPGGLSGAGGSITIGSNNRTRDPEPV